MEVCVETENAKTDSTYLQSSKLHFFQRHLQSFSVYCYSVK